MVGVGLLTLRASSVVPYANVNLDAMPSPSVVTTPAPSVPTTLTSPPAVAGPAPGTVVLVGDSSMYDTTPALAAAFNAAGWRVVDASYPGIGITKPGARLRAMWGRTVRDNDADLVVVMLGSWDIDWVRSHGDDAYRQQLDEAVVALTSSGTRVLWLSMLPGGLTADRPVDRFFEELPRRYPTVAYLDIEAALRGARATGLPASAIAFSASPTPGTSALRALPRSPRSCSTTCASRPATGTAGRGEPTLVTTIPRAAACDHPVGLVSLPVAMSKERPWTQLRG